MAWPVEESSALALWAPQHGSYNLDVVLSWLHVPLSSFHKKDRGPSLTLRPESPCSVAQSTAVSI